MGKNCNILDMEQSVVAFYFSFLIDFLMEIESFGNFCGFISRSRLAAYQMTLIYT